MGKRGQFTLFVVLGIVVLLLLVVFFIFRSDIFSFVGISEELVYPSEVQEVADSVQDCLDASAYDAVTEIGYTGGYYIPPERYFYSEELGLEIPYFYDDGEDRVISLEILERELDLYIGSIFSGCVIFEGFSEFQITAGDVEVSSLIDADSVFVELSYPVIVAVENSTYVLSESYQTVVPARLGFLRDVAEAIVVYDQEHPNYFDYTFLLAQDVNDIFVAAVTNDTYVYVLEDNRSFAGEQNLTFVFAEYYSALPPFVECAEDSDCFVGTCVDEKCVVEEEEEE